METDAPTARDIFLLGMSQRTGLSVLTCDDLTRRGWVLVEKINEPRRWVDPSSNLRVR